MKNLVVGIFAVVLATGVNAQQDKHFSMFAESPVYLNPATAGFFPGQLQLFTNFRMQWLTVSDNPYRTISGSMDWRMMDRGSFMGMGVNFYNDVAGDGQYMINEITIPINYAIEIAKDNHISIGLQPAWYSRTLQSANFTWDNQWTGTEFNTSLNSNENIFGQNLNINKFDLSAGVYWYAHLNRNLRVSLGIAGHHLTKQKIQFYELNEDKLFRKLTLHGQFAIGQSNSNLTILPAFYGFVQGSNMELTLGSNFRYVLRGSSRVTGYFEEMAINWGAYYRLGDAAIVNAMFDISGFTVGASYDFNLSGLSPATGGVGGFEVLLRYRMQFGRGGLGNPSIH